MSRSVSAVVVFICIALASLGSTARADLTLVKAGQACAAIVTPDSPSQAEHLAAERLQFYVEKMSGAKLPVVREADAAGGTNVFVGATKAGSGVSQKLQAKRPPEEASLVSVTQDGAYIIGADEAGILHATYFLLEDLGCRWYFPADWGTVIPKLVDITLPDGEQYRAPDFAIRTGLPITGLAADPDPSWTRNEWGRGNHLGGWLWWGSGHSYQYLVSPDNFKEHPEWFPWRNGARHTRQLCTTHPEVRQAALQTVLNQIGADQPRLICVSPNDGTDFCECDNCRKLIPTKADGTKDLDNSIDRIVEFANFIADNIREQYPRHYVTYMCDYHSVGTPTLVTPAKNTVFWIVQWGQDHFHGVTPETKMGQSLERWSKFGNPIFLYTYYGSYGSFTFWPQVHAIRNDIPYYKSKGAIGMYSQTEAHWGTQHLNFIVYPRLLWDTKTDVDALIDDFCNRFYGPAAEPMRKYYTLLEDTGRYGPGQSQLHSGIIAIFNPTVLSQLRELIEQAKQLVADAELVYRQRMQFVADGFRMADEYISANYLMNEYGRTKDPAIRQKMISMYKEVLGILTAPQYKGRMSPNWWSADIFLKKELGKLEQGTSYGVGKFSYKDDYRYPHGGWTALDTVRLCGFISGEFGLYMNAGGTGELVYDFGAEDGSFAKVAVHHVKFGSNMVGIRVEVGDSADGPWTLAYAHENPDAANPSKVPANLDLTDLVKGKSRFFLRLVATNKGGGYVCGLCGLGVVGEVVAKP